VISSENAQYLYQILCDTFFLKRGNGGEEGGFDPREVFCQKNIGGKKEIFFVIVIGYTVCEHSCSVPTESSNM
jgi:hypothetical protein